MTAAMEAKGVSFGAGGVAFAAQGMPASRDGGAPDHRQSPYRL
jgi:hypothetical protein